MSIINPLNPLQQVRLSCDKVFEVASFCKICDEGIEKFAESVLQEGTDKFRQEVEWDQCGWHYAADAKLDPIGKLTCQYIFVLDSLNFCFWPTPGLEYDFLASRLKAVLESDESAFDAQRLLAITQEEVMGWFSGFEIPLLSERVARLRELGQGLMDDFDGIALNVVRKANCSASQLVTLILRHFPGFRDTSIFKGSLVHFYKRAQILVGDVWAAYGRPTETSHPCCFHDIDQLTMFADYRNEDATPVSLECVFDMPLLALPQILRVMGILEYSPALASKIDEKVELTCGSEEELEIRACTIVAVERLQKALNARGLPLLVIEVDWLLWQKGEAIKDTIPPHHRTLTIYY